MRTSLLETPGTLTTYPAASHRGRSEWLSRAALHMACWVPFITTAANSWRGPWRAVGDPAHVAITSWNTLSGWIPLLGQPNELPGGPHDLGPLEYWLLAVPVHVDVARGVLWGAVLLTLLAVSLTVEAGISVLGETGGLLAAGAVIAAVSWYPGFAARPEDNPNFGFIFFIASLSVGLAVLSGHRKWWPVLVVTASVAAQAHLTYAAACVGLVLIAAVAGLADQFRAKGGYSWLIAGLVAGAVCWMAPLEQQFTSPAGKGNMSLLLNADGEMQRVGFAFAIKALASLAVPSPLWWRQNISQRHDLYQMLGSQSVALGLVILALMAASLVVAVCWFRSRVLAGLAAISLLVSVSAVVSFAFIPVYVRGHAERQHDLIFVMFAAVVLAWLTVSCAAVLAAIKLISVRRGRAGANGGRARDGQRDANQSKFPLPMFRRPIRGVAALLLVITVLLGAARQVARYADQGTNSSHVSEMLTMIERSLPGRPVIGLSVSAARKADRFQVLQGLCLALTAEGYYSGVYTPETAYIEHKGPLTEVAVVLRGRRMTVTTIRISRDSPGRWRSCPALIGTKLTVKAMPRLMEPVLPMPTVSRAVRGRRHA